MNSTYAPLEELDIDQLLNHLHTKEENEKRVEQFSTTISQTKSIFSEELIFTEPNFYNLMNFDAPKENC